ncbi:unnamed protein product [Cuscuta europaea]|uniref:Uncharacterized protein n=1 Tax=Cuscuta europaea TaxID=41803 RepID=A0A9P1A017_CUSEU|nr:unnamed protein product [Cuscuta europaea]
MLGIFSRLSVIKGGHRRAQSALDKREDLGSKLEGGTVVGTASAAVLAGDGCTHHGITEVEIAFNPAEHPSEPFADNNNDNPIYCPLPEPPAASILNYTWGSLTGTMEDWGLFWEKMREDTRRLCERIRKISPQRNNRHSQKESRTNSHSQELQKESRTVSHLRKKPREEVGKLGEKDKREKMEKEKRSTLENEKRSNMEKEKSSKPEKEKSSNLEKGKPKLRQKCRRRGWSRTVRRCLNSKSKYPSQSQDTSSGPLVLTRADKSSSKSLFEFPESQQNLVIQQNTYGEEEFSDKPSVNLEPEDGTVVGFSRRPSIGEDDWQC